MAGGCSSSAAGRRPVVGAQFENRHGRVWRVEWHGTWYIAELDTHGSAPRETGLDELVEFAMERLRD